MPEEPTELGFDRNRTIAAKLGRTLLLLVLGGYFLGFTALVFAPGWNLWWQVAAKIVIETCWSFWLLALVFVWWMPPWLHRLYVHVEAKMLSLAVLLKWTGLGLTILAIAFVLYLSHLGVLPKRQN